MIAVVEAYRAGLFARERWIPNIIAGVVVGVVALPLAMAFAIASGARPEHGLYTAIVAGLIVSTCGGSRLQIAGPTGAFIVILAGITAKYGIDGLRLATIMAGCILVALGAAKLGGVIKFIPAPVIVGFTTGIGVVIFVGQWSNFLGLPATAGVHFHEKLWALLRELPHLDPNTTAIACLSLAILVLAPRVPQLKKIPAPLITLIVATCISALWRPAGLATIGTAFGGIPQGLPSLQLPTATPAQLIELLAPAFTIAMLGAIESLLSAVVADGMAGTKHDSNQELVGQGVANVIAPLFGGFAATGALARTATNIRNGGSSPLAGVTHAAVLVLVMLVLAPLATHVPLAALAAILFVVAYNMSELHNFARMLRRAPRADVAILLVTFTLTVFADLVVAVNVGVILAILQFLRRMASTVEVRSLHESVTGEQDNTDIRPPLPRGVQVFAIHGPLFFGAVENFERALIQTHTEPEALVIRLRDVPFMDITGLQVLESVVERLRKRGVTVILCEANARVLGKLQRAAIVSTNDGIYVDRFATALERAGAVVTPRSADAATTSPSIR